MAKRDELRGLKENVIVGRLIPAGTGLAYHKAHRAKELAEKLERVTQEFVPQDVEPFVNPEIPAEPASDPFFFTTYQAPEEEGGDKA